MDGWSEEAKSSFPPPSVERRPTSAGPCGSRADRVARRPTAGGVCRPKTPAAARTPQFDLSTEPLRRDLELLDVDGARREADGRRSPRAAQRSRPTTEASVSRKARPSTAKTRREVGARRWRQQPTTPPWNGSTEQPRKRFDHLYKHPGVRPDSAFANRKPTCYDPAFARIPILTAPHRDDLGPDIAPTRPYRCLLPMPG